MLHRESVLEWLRRLAPAMEGAIGKCTGKDALLVLRAWEELSCRNSRVVAFNDVLTSCVRSNSAPMLLGAEASARAAMFYLAKYITKDSTSMQASVAVLADARKHIDKWPSVADDSGTIQRTAKHFAQRALNRLTMELSDTQAASCVLGFSADVCSDTFLYVPMQSAVEGARLLLAGGDLLHPAGKCADSDSEGEGEDVDDDDDLEELEEDLVGGGAPPGARPRKFVGRDDARVHMEGGEDRHDSAHGVHLGGIGENCPAGADSFTDVNGAVLVLPLLFHYLHRGQALSRFNFVEWAVCFRIGLIDERPEAPGERRGAGRPRNGR